MSDTNPTDAAQLFVHADKKIEKIVSEVTELIKKDLGLDHKMDLVLQAQVQLKERFDHSSMTGHKTWEAVQGLVASIEKVNARVENQQMEIKVSQEAIRDVKDVNKWVVRGIFGVVFLSVFASVMTFLWHLKP